MDRVVEPRDEQQLRAILATRTGPLQALGAGASLAGRTLAVGLPLSLAYGLVSGLGGAVVVGLATATATAEAPTIELGAQIAGALAAFCTLYALVQFPKREKASRSSWWPALFAVPLWVVCAALAVVMSGQARQMGPVVAQLLIMAWSLVWSSFGGAAVATGWVLAGKAALDGRSFGLSEALDAVRVRTLDVAGAHGAKVHAVTIGMQVLLPGILYALQYAFVDMVAVLDPEKASLRRSGQLTSGMRGRIFRLLLAYTLFGQVVSFGLFAAVTGATDTEKLVEAGWAFLMDPTAMGEAVQVTVEILWALLTWVCTLALLVLYVEREGQVKAKTELKQLQKASGGAAPGTSETAG